MQIRALSKLEKNTVKFIKIELNQQLGRVFTERRL